MNLDNRHGAHGKAGSSDLIIGRFTYGFEFLTIREWGEGAALKIGSFCSIADNVTCFLGGNHQTDWGTTFPFGEIYLEEFGGADISGHTPTKGDICIGHDVWIGSGATIMSGITIGDGAIIAANAVVVKDVAPYSLVGGNPAKHLKYRCSEECRELLLKLCWWDLTIEQIRSIVPDLAAQPNAERLRSLVTRFRGAIPTISYEDQVFDRTVA